jgi:hypothetical protein
MLWVMHVGEIGEDHLADHPTVKEHLIRSAACRKKKSVGKGAGAEMS